MCKGSYAKDRHTVVVGFDDDIDGRRTARARKLARLENRLDGEWSASWRRHLARIEAHPGGLERGGRDGGGHRKYGLAHGEHVRAECAGMLERDVDGLQCLPHFPLFDGPRFFDLQHAK